MRNGRNLRELSMPSNRWVVLALLFAVRVSTGIQYQAVASLSPQLMSGFVLSIAVIGLSRVSGWRYRRMAWGQTRCAHWTGAYGHRRDRRGDRAELADSDGR